MPSFNPTIISKLIPKRYIKLFETSLLVKKVLKQFNCSKVPEPFLSFKIIHQEASKRSKQNELSIVKKVYLMKKMLKLRSMHYPIQYICKEWPFKQIVLEMRPPVLIPRFQTEQMLTILFQKLDQIHYFQNISKSKQLFKFAELGCGTGAIGLSIIKELTKRDIQFQGKMIDIQRIAVNLANRNLKKNNLDLIKQRVKIIQEDMLQFLQDKKNFDKLSMIISNPPYISTKQYNGKYFQKQVKKFQSKVALVGDQKMNENGLFYIERIVQKWKQNPNFILALQYGGEDLKNLGQQIQEAVQLDYYGKRRFIILIPRNS